MFDKRGHFRFRQITNFPTIHAYACRRCAGCTHANNSIRYYIIMFNVTRVIVKEWSVINVNMEHSNVKDFF